MLRTLQYRQLRFTSWSKYRSPSCSSAAPTASSLHCRTTIIMARGVSTLSPAGAIDHIRPYTITIQGTAINVKTTNLTKADIYALFGAFEPFNVVIHGAPVDIQAYFDSIKGPRRNKTFPLATFQVPGLTHVREVVQSFDNDETWGEKIRVQQESETYPILLENLKLDITAAELKEAIDKESIMDVEVTPAPEVAEVEGGETLLSRTRIDVYDSFAVLHFPDRYSSMGLLQGVLCLETEQAGPQKSENQIAFEQVDQEGPREAVTSTGHGQEDQEVDEPTRSPAQTELVESGQAEGEDDEIISTPAWATYPVRVNNLPPDITPEALEFVFANEHVVGYDFAILPAPPNAASRSAYIRFATKDHARACVRACNGLSWNVALQLREGPGTRDAPEKGLDNGKELDAIERQSGKDPHRLHVRPAWQKHFSLVIREQPSYSHLGTELQDRGLAPAEVEVIDVARQDLVLRYDDGDKAAEAAAWLQHKIGERVSRGWRPFVLELANLPFEWGKEELADRVEHPGFYKVDKEHGSPLGKISCWGKGDAERIYLELSASRLSDVKLRKLYNTYRLTLRGISNDTTKEELLNVLRGYEPYQIDFLLSRKGRRKGQALLRFSNYDDMRVAIARLYGRDAPIDEEIHRRSMLDFDSSQARQVADEEIEEMGPEEQRLRLRTDELPGEPAEEEVSSEDSEAETQKDLQSAPRIAKDCLKLDDDSIDVSKDDSSQSLPGVWLKILMDTDTTQKVLPGGQLLSHRALIVIGNLQGAGGWGVGKGRSSDEAKRRAIQNARKNLVHMDLYRDKCIAVPLHGKHNACRVYIRAGDPQRPHKQNRMVNEILEIMGVQCGEARTFGKRNPYSVVRAIFDALSKHQGMEEISRRRGRRLISLSKARYLGL